MISQIWIISSMSTLMTLIFKCLGGRRILCLLTFKGSEMTTRDLTAPSLSSLLHRMLSAWTRVIAKLLRKWTTQDKDKLYRDKSRSFWKMLREITQDVTVDYALKALTNTPQTLISSQDLGTISFNLTSMTSTTWWSWRYLTKGRVFLKWWWKKVKKWPKISNQDKELENNNSTGIKIMTSLLRATCLLKINKSLFLAYSGQLLNSITRVKLRMSSHQVIQKDKFRTYNKRIEAIMKVQDSKTCTLHLKINSIIK